MELWGGRFRQANDERLADFSRSIEIDGALADDDLVGSIAHVHGLAAAGLLSDDESATLVAGLAWLRAEVAAGTIAWDPALEDIHLNLEAALGARIGPLAGRLHTGRSRNDQVATDLRLWSRRAVADLDNAILGAERALVALARREGDAILPGTTHIQPAQPILFGHHLLAYVEMLERDRGRFADAARRLNRSPLGSGALAGAGLVAFSSGLLGMYARTPGMRKEDGWRPSQQGIPLAKDVWMLGIGLGLVERVERQPRVRLLLAGAVTAGTLELRGDAG